MSGKNRDRLLIRSHAGLVKPTEAWRQSHVHARRESVRSLRVEAGAIACPQPWLSWVNGLMQETDV